MPIGANEVTVLDHTGGYAIFVNEGKSATPHAILEVRTGAGDLIWRFDRDGPKPLQVIPAQVARDMAGMMNKVVEEGTGKRAMLDGIKAGGKTGTTNSYRDAWFVGYTGNYIGGVWFGNDDYSSLNRMTGGALPAQTWHAIMAYAHQGVELKPYPGTSATTVASRTAPPPVVAAPAPSSKTGSEIPQRPALLTRRGADILVRVERLMDDATRALAIHDEQGRRVDTKQPARPDTLAATDRPPPSTARGN
jgi:penicillin-binding protein 1A